MEADSHGILHFALTVALLLAIIIGGGERANQTN
jgi:hypothetical protein